MIPRVDSKPAYNKVENATIGMMINKFSDLSHRAEAKAPSLAARLMSVVLTPHDTFATIVKKPRPWGVLIVICLSVGGASGWLISTDVGQQAALEQQV